DVRVAVEGQRVALAQREELDGPLDELADAAVRSAVALGREGGKQLGVALVALGGVEKGPQVAGRRRPGAGGVEVHAEGLEDLGGVALEPLPLLGGDGAGTGLLPAGCFLGIESKR